MRFTFAIASVLFAAAGLVRAEDYRLLYQIPAGDTIDTFTTDFTNTCSTWKSGVAAGLDFIEAYIQPGDYTGANADTEALIFCTWANANPVVVGTTVTTYTECAAGYLGATQLIGVI
ncbi:hypothetical protein K438DRAFT_1850891 [Mycena galopus ATCC 62051]|nr:hypothetical protein K438DRAFT_1850891 [Mycena galopus ATCC 62051]